MTIQSPELSCFSQRLGTIGSACLLAMAMSACGGSGGNDEPAVVDPGTPTQPGPVNPPPVNPPPVDPGLVTVQRTLDYTTTGPDGMARATQAIVTRRNVEERRPVVVFAPGWGGMGNVPASNSGQANSLAAQGYVAVDLGFHQAGGAWTSDIAYSANAALDKLCADMQQYANCDAIIWVGTSYAGTQSLVVTRYLRAAGKTVLGFVSQDAGYTKHWSVPTHANLADHSVALIENQGDATFPIDACDASGNCGARERATWHRNNGVNLDKIVSWCPAGGNHGTRNNVAGGSEGWDNWVSSAIKSMLHVQREVPTFTGYTQPIVAVSNTCVNP